MSVTVRYFASVREALGPGEDVEIAAGANIAALRDALAARGGRHAEALGRQRVLRSARNRLLCAEDTPLADGDEIGFFPPLTGG
ncbi:MAG TPA: MoaD/ThiS family protein [Caldimonas sp.]|jgi:molybdopterin synthase sulfur carrier subunit